MKPRRYLSNDAAKEIMRRYQAGEEPATEIAADFGVDPSYPGLLAKRSGIPLRRPNRLSAPQFSRKGQPQ